MITHSAPSRGWVKIHRQLLHPDHPLHPRMRGEEACYLAAWIDLIGFAQWSSHGPLNAGQLEASEDFLRKRWNWTRKKVRYFLKKLEGRNMIRRNTNRGSRPSIITIVNYSKYQSAQKQGMSSSTGGGTASGTAAGPTTGSQTAGRSARPRHTGGARGPTRGPDVGPGDGATSGTQEEEVSKQKEEFGRSPVGDSPSCDGGGPSTRLGARSTEGGSARSNLQEDVKSVLDHWHRWLRWLSRHRGLTRDELEKYANELERADARAKFRESLQNDGISVEQLRLVIDYVMQTYFENGDRLPWGGNLRPSSFLQNEKKVRDRLQKAREASYADGTGPGRNTGDPREQHRRRAKAVARKTRLAKEKQRS